MTDAAFPLDDERLTDPFAVHSLIPGPDSDSKAGRVVWDPVHSLWNGGMTAAALILCPLTVSLGAVAVFLATSAATLLIGHSVGYHRRLVHRSFECPRWLDHVLVWFGSLVGMSGPFWIIRAHDMRDWAQRQPQCHPALRHGAPIVTDYLWNLHGRLVLERPPAFAPPPWVAQDRFYRLLERTWMLQQLPIAALLWLAGGWGFVAWGVCARITISVTGHWFIGRLAHRTGPQSYLVDGAGVQAHDVPWAAIPTFGEAWHNNHHAWPGSAKMGVRPGQIDLGYGFIRVLERVGLAWRVQTPETLPVRTCLSAAAPEPPPTPRERAADALVTVIIFAVLGPIIGAAVIVEVWAGVMLVPGVMFGWVVGGLPALATGIVVACLPRWLSQTVRRTVAATFGAGASFATGVAFASSIGQLQPLVFAAVGAIAGLVCAEFCRRDGRAPFGLRRLQEPTTSAGRPASP